MSRLGSQLRGIAQQPIRAAVSVDGWGQSMMGEPRKGRPNRINRDIKEMVLGALNRLGGTKYRDARL
jgi:hypothetical protein